MWKRSEPVRAILHGALLAAAITGLLTAPILGLQMKLEGLRIVIDANWQPVLLSMLAVLLAQLLRPLVALAWAWLKSPGAAQGTPGTTQGAAGGSAKRPGRLAWLTALSGPRLLSEARQRQAVALLIVLALAWPFVASRSAIDVATLALIYVMLGLGLNIVVGHAGLLDLGFVGFYAVGAYSYALLFEYAGLGFWASLPIATATAALFGFLLGFPVLRLRGDYLAIVTLGFGEIIRLLLNNLDSITGGPDGIGGIPKPSIFGLQLTRSASAEGIDSFHAFFGLDWQSEHMVVFLYAVALALALLTLFVCSRLVRMPMGRAWEALRDDEIACRSLGLDPTRIKLSAFTLGAAFAGLAGCFFAARQSLVTPESFSFIESALILAVVVLGGMGSRLGVVLAAILITALPEMARGFADYRMLGFGLVMVLMMIWRPQGLLPATRAHVELPE
jgi:branched-chain amino acid transport system permease protein